MTRIFAELNEPQTRIAIHFPYDAEAVEVMRSLKPKGARAIKDAAGRWHWEMPLTLESGRLLREEFGPALDLGIGIRAWGRDAVKAERQMASLATAGDAELENVRPDAAAWLRPYQRADVAMMARANVINANQPGTGKTVEVIYAVEEAGLHGPHIVVAPASLHKDPWRDELAKHAPNARVLYGATPQQRRGAINFVALEQDAGRAGDIWLILTPADVRVKRWEAHELEILSGTPAWSNIMDSKLSSDHKGNVYAPKGAELPPLEQGGNLADFNLFELRTGALVADEFHKFGLGADRNTLFARGLAALRKNAQRAFALSGTPTGGKPIRLFGPLNFIEPDLYTSKWRWAGLWLTNADGSGPVNPGAGTGIGGLQPGRETDFYKAHERVMVRRTRSEALPGMPPKLVQNVWVDMTPKQAAQYRELEKMTEVEVEGGTLTTDGILSEFTRLKQIANSKMKIEALTERYEAGVKGIRPDLSESGKLPVLLDHLDTFGLRKDDPEPGARAIVASASQVFIEALEPVLAAAGLNVRRLDGTVINKKSRADRDDVIDWYKEESADARVLVMTTETGGVGLNLGMTDVIVVLDETWNPDDQEQLEDRGMRDRTTPLNVLYLRTRGTVQEYIWEIGLEKGRQNKKVLADALRQRMRAASTPAAA
jgi:SNF2 family DNA or RNA helicase